jgi:hypothetical protein
MTALFSPLSQQSPPLELRRLPHLAGVVLCIPGCLRQRGARGQEKESAAGYGGQPRRRPATRRGSRRDGTYKSGISAAHGGSQHYGASKLCISAGDESSCKKGGGQHSNLPPFLSSLAVNEIEHMNPIRSSSSCPATAHQGRSHLEPPLAS